nr:hypothetical protein Itr_chr14CG01960 [Ipomoea trifida]GMD92893.1 hypothetical protein Iba_chr14fCG2170 [Ipomoea batatas]
MEDDMQKSMVTGHTHGHFPANPALLWSRLFLFTLLLHALPFPLFFRFSHFDLEYHSHHRPLQPLPRNLHKQTHKLYAFLFSFTYEYVFAIIM